MISPFARVGSCLAARGRYRNLGELAAISELDQSASKMTLESLYRMTGSDLSSLEVEPTRFVGHDTGQKGQRNSLHAPRSFDSKQRAHDQPKVVCRRYWEVPLLVLLGTT